ncbi:MAG: putative rane-bound dehydrogenase [Phycisphaerales bacterium]|nr:putative rane-bound dehydrogenase [Phycisphaerales bacterium]
MHLSRKFAALFASAAASCAPLSAYAADPLLKIEKGDHVCIIGNALPDRMQHDGWLETYLYARHPADELVVRNLAKAGDEIDYTKRMRSKDFGTPDQWLAGSAPIPQPKKISDPKVVRENRFELTNTKADVVFMFFGYNESFAGDAGLPKFKKDLDQLLKHTAEQRYNGKGAPRVVLFGPIAHEDLKDPNLPDGKANNDRLAKYTAAMAEVAQANGTPFVDLFAVTQKLYAAAAKPLTINGVHLSADGNQQVAEAIDAALGGGEAAKTDAGKLAAIRAAVVDKAEHWFDRYRVTDGYNVYGARAFEQYADKQTNYENTQRELEVLDVMTANRDKAVWAAAQGSAAAGQTVDDSNVPPFVVVKTNKPGTGPGGEHTYQDGESAIKDMKLAPGLKVQLFADEKRFPELIKPVQMSFDTKGRLWVATWPDYPNWVPGTPKQCRLLILEDTNGDGVADACKTFAGDLHNPTGFEFYNGGVIVAQGPDLWFMKDTDGDDKVDVRERVLLGFDTADTHHTINSFTFDPGGALYMQEGTFLMSQVETPWGPAERSANACVWRYEPRTSKLGVYAAYGFANPHGHVFDRWGTDIVTDGTGAVPYYGPAFSGHLDHPLKHTKAPTVFKQWVRPCAGTELLASSHFPQYFGNYLYANVIGFQGILNYKLTPQGGGLVGTEVTRPLAGGDAAKSVAADAQAATQAAKPAAADPKAPGAKEAAAGAKAIKPGTEREPILVSTDPNFRPSDLEVAPDGSLYFTDWQNSIIGHLQHNVRDPSRDKMHGRIYRITNANAPLLKAPAIAGAPVHALLALLKSPEDRVRYRAKIELSGRPSAEVVAAAKKWAAALDKSDKDYAHQLTEALWVHQWHNAVDVDLLKQVLASPEPMARAAGVRVLCYWRDRVPSALDLLRTAAKDDHPRVALEAVRACSFFGKDQAEAATEVALEAVEKHEADPFVKYVLDETNKQLEAVQKAPVAIGSNTLESDFDVRGVRKQPQAPAAK